MIVLQENLGTIDDDRDINHLLIMSPATLCKHKTTRSRTSSILSITILLTSNNREHVVPQLYGFSFKISALKI